jgi:parallel beta-helix repeat protein
LCLFASPAAQGAEYYVSPSGNDITGTGTISNPWASITKGQSMLNPGDTLLVRGGRYYESVTLTKQGMVGLPITIAAYADPETKIRETPVLDGTEVVTGWEKCGPDDAFLTVQGVINPNYDKIYKAKVPASRLPADLANSKLFENGVQGRIARWPDQKLGYGVDMSLFASLGDSNGLTGHIIDNDALVNPVNYWVNAWVYVYSSVDNHNLIRRTITASSSHRIDFSSLGVTINSSEDCYSIVNHPHVLDSAGEFAFTTTVVDGCYTVYLWPAGSVLMMSEQEIINYLSNNVRLPRLENGVYGGGKSYVVIDGLKVLGWGGSGIYFENANHIIVKNCIVEDIILGGSGISGHGVLLYNAGHSTIESCTISRTGNRGAFIWTGSYGVIKDCVVRDTESTNISFFTMTNGQIIGNTMYGCIGGHGNASSCYFGCDKILMANNYYPGSNMVFSSVTKLVVYGNIFDSKEQSFFTCAIWGDNGVRTQGPLLFLHNTILGDSRNSALQLFGQTDMPYPEYYIFNNILDGCSVYGINQINDISYNLYTGYSDFQINPYWGWTLKTGEIDGRGYALSQIFKSPGVANGGDYKLTAASPVIGKGKDISGLLHTIGVTTWFPDFDFTKDKAGNTWAATPSMGAYEYAPANIIYGDISGDSALTAYDAALAARIAVGLDAYPTGDKLTAADVSGDKAVTAYDAALIAQKAVGLITKFPVEG